MKTRTFILVVVMLGLSGCQFLTRKNGVDFTTVVVDKTDSLSVAYELTAAHVDKTLRISDNPYAGASVKLTTVTDNRYSESWQVSIDDESIFWGNDYTRPDEITDFFDSLHGHIEDVRNQK